VSKKIKILIAILFLSCFLFLGQASVASAANPIYSIAVSGNVTLNKLDSYARIILTDISGNEYLIYEAQGPFDSDSFSFENTCEETCVLNKIVPKKVDVELSGATIHIDKIFMIEDRAAMNAQVQTMGMQTYQKALVPIQEDVKIDKINGYIEKNNLRWTAGKTSISDLTYAQKKQIFNLSLSSNRALDGSPLTASLPNIMAFSFYSGGILELSSYGTIPFSSPNFPQKFDWRDRHGVNWITPVENQGLCGACWAFSSTGAIEAVARLYFNQPLNVNLSKQELISCERLSIIGPCLSGNTIPNALEYCRQNGITTRTCFPYISFSGIAPLCSIKSHQCNESVTKITNWHALSGDLSVTLPPREIEEALKETIIKYGPVTLGINSLSHAMVITGWETDPKDNKPVWIVKNSYGEFWGESGYIRLKTPFTNMSQVLFIIPPLTISNRSNLEIACVDKDNDNYCNWGISTQKPATCSASCRPEKDCDDSNPNLGPFDENFNCRTVDSTPTPSPMPSPTPSPSPSPSPTPTPTPTPTPGPTCPNCQSNHTDICETPPRCEKDCGADDNCDEKENNSSWSSQNNCYSCKNSCNYNIDNTKPSNHQLNENICFYDCDINCELEGWTTVYIASKCETENCPATKISGDNCYYLRSCGTSGCRYLNTDINKECSSSSCTESGWNNSACQDQPPKPYDKELYVTEGFNNPNDYIDGSLYCDSDDSMISWKCVPNDNNDTVKYSWKTGDNGWFCGFKCNGWCTADGTIKITCQP